MSGKLTEAREGQHMTPTSFGFGGDAIDPDWAKAGHVHDWRNYISEEVQAMWHTFTPEQRIALARQADEQADREEWE